LPYIGKNPIIGNYTVLDSLTATTTDTYALTKNSVAVFPQTPANCIVSLNGVIQAPISSFTISGSNIVFASALTTSDVIDFIQVLGDVLNIGTPSDGTVGIAKLSATGTPSSSTFLRGDNSWQSAGGANTPAFEAYLSSDQAVSLMTFTKISMDTEIYDTDNCYNNSTYTFTPNVAGKYLVYASLQSVPNAWSVTQATAFEIRKNNSIYKRIYWYDIVNRGTNFNISGNVVVDMNGTTDYLEIYGNIWQGSSTGSFGSSQKVTSWGAYKIIE
jgi:hypothetical protein